MQFGSPISLLPGWNSNWKENLKSWGEAIIGKGGGFFGSGLSWGGGQLTRSGTAQVSLTIEAWASTGIALVEKLGTVGRGAATATDVLAHAGCNATARQSAGQMTPLPPGWSN